MSIAVARQAIRELEALADETIKRAKLGYWLKADPPIQRRGLWACEEILSHVNSGSSTSRALLGCVLSSLLNVERAIQLRLLALTRSEQLLVTRAVLQANLISIIPSEQREDRTYLTDSQGRTLSLGERRALARKPTPQSLERLLTDPDPIVLSHLLQNPRLTESLLLKIVTRRPQQPQTLFEIFEHPKWGQREEVKRALALNPSTPLPLRCILIFSLTVEEKESLRLERPPRLLLAALNRLGST